ncbi:hypothetical protein, partial [Aestuariivirga sp.]|uniref:hypothetical protein n=1 Tax=Aestuariivirga sp. TaxID=2650926 RepID=UPI00378359F6
QTLTVGGGNGETDTIAHPLRFARQQAVGNLQSDSFVPANPLARVPTRWNHLVEKNSRKFNGLSMIFSQKWFPLLRIML